METVSHRPQDTFHGIKAPLQQRRRHIRALNRQPEYQPQQRAEQQPAGEASGQHPIGSHRARLCLLVFFADDAPGNLLGAPDKPACNRIRRLF